MFPFRCSSTLSRSIFDQKCQSQLNRFRSSITLINSCLISLSAHALAGLVSLKPPNTTDLVSLRFKGAPYVTPSSLVQSISPAAAKFRALSGASASSDHVTRRCAAVTRIVEIGVMHLRRVRMCFYKQPPGR